MRDIKTKPAMDAPKVRQKAPAPRDAGVILKRHLDKRQQEKEPENRDPVRYATDHTEQTMRRSAAFAADKSRRMVKHWRGQRRKDVPVSSTVAAEYPDAQPFPGAESSIKKRPGSRQKPRPETNGKGTPWRNLAGTGTAGWHAAPRPSTPTPAHPARAAAQKWAQRAMLQRSVKSGGKAAKKLGGAALQTVKAVGRSAASAVSSLLTAGGGAVVLVLLLTVLLAAAIAASPFGIFFSNESREAGVVPLSAAVAQVNYDFNARLEALQTADSYDSVSVDGSAADWAEVLAIFAVKVAGSDDVDAADVATMDPDRIARLKAVFWDMTAIAHRVEVIEHPGSGEGEDSWTERNLYITISAKTAEEMEMAYRFDRDQITALDELLEQRDLLLELIEDVTSVSGDTAALLRSLPEDLPPEREAVVRTACALVGKVNYFWGGKSLVISWDARWGELRKVTAEGSYTTGTYRPYGLDCSGLVDWVFYNQSGGSYVLGHGGGAASQHAYCDPISWTEAQPGDLVFSDGDSHVGIVGGRDGDGELRIIHCAGGYNNVVITDASGFTSIGRSVYYSVTDGTLLDSEMMVDIR